jgi:hypothetical protein
MKEASGKSRGLFFNMRGNLGFLSWLFFLQVGIIQLGFSSRKLGDIQAGTVTAGVNPAYWRR